MQLKSKNNKIKRNWRRRRQARCSQNNITRRDTSGTAFRGKKRGKPLMSIPIIRIAINEGLLFRKF